MFKKLAITFVCLSCLNSFAYPSPFGIEIGKANAQDIRKNTSNKPSTTKPENILGYKEIYLNTEGFSINDNRPTFAKIFANQEGVVEALVLEYKNGNAADLITDLDKKYSRTYSRETFYGSCDVEYKNGDCLIRIIKPFGGSTLFLYGTIRWFKAYDDYYKQGADIRKKRREHNLKQIADSDDVRSNDENDAVLLAKSFDEQFEHFRRNLWGKWWNLDDFNEFIENTKKISKNDGNAKVKSYRTEKKYSKIGDVEEWFFDDNGYITKIRKTPQGTTVTHDGDRKSAKREEETNEQLLYGRQIKDTNL
ncbi:MAG: hypothetical protein LBS23_01625 [Holosporaceae bacterium]|jgi:hypothetical protein|nr:hypothetical protein [Holosporaceae bacterium]